VRNRKYRHCERKEVDVCLSDLKEEELLDLRKREELGFYRRAALNRCST
jgi:hypothetical protein